LSRGTLVAKAARLGCLRKVKRLVEGKWDSGPYDLAIESCRQLKYGHIADYLQQQSRGLPPFSADDFDVTLADEPLRTVEQATLHTLIARPTLSRSDRCLPSVRCPVFSE
jgi:hypothetical protein